jgi:16S rRNA (cytosine967-C5)-methyltransferase
MPPSVPTARSLALHVLLTDRPGGEFAGERLDEALHDTPLPPADRRFATQLVYGTIRRRGTLDALIRAHINRPKARVARGVWELLRLGTYQLALLTHVPPHAAINETVELTKRGPHARAAGFVNGVLRNIARSLTDERVPSPAADGLPLSGGEYRKLARPLLPDPMRNPGDYLADGLSLQRWLVERWLARFGFDETLRLGFWFADAAPLWLRVNPLRTNRDDLRKTLAGAGFESELGEHPQALRLVEYAPVRSLPGYAEGWLTVQDESAMRAASALAPLPGWNVLDLCAAPGGKTTHLAELMENRGRIVACDVDERRLATVGELAKRLGISIVEPHLLTDKEAIGRSEPRPSGSGGASRSLTVASLTEFDAALVDVPCSNTGVLGRRPEVRWRLKPGDLSELVPLQTRLLQQACALVRPGGVVVYSTCSIEPEENGGVVRSVLRDLPGWTLDAEQEHRPGLPADGGYWARLRQG